MSKLFFSNVILYGPRFLLVLLMASFTAASGSVELSEYEIKAGFLYNFATFVQWPKEVKDPLNLCIYGKDPFGGNLQNLQGKKVGERHLNVMGTVSKDNIDKCHILYIAREAKTELPGLLSILDGKPVLTIADVVSATSSGVMLNMIVKGNKLTFEANQKSARAQNLRISSRLLSLATKVI